MDAARPGPARGSSLDGKRILLIIGGGIAAYKCLELIRRLKERGIGVRVVMTPAAKAFVTPLSVAAITGDRIYSDLFSLDEESEIGHIRLARDTDLIVVAPATADLLARVAGGHADDLATAVLMAAKGPVLIAPAMNPAMWANPATQRNVEMLRRDGRQLIGPSAGEMAERNEAGIGRMAEPMEIVARIQELLAPAAGPLSGLRVLVTTGPTHEPIDPVRYIANRSSGKQGLAIARAAAEQGADVVLVSGPTGLADPKGIRVVHVETAQEMLAAAEAALPVDIGIFTAAVADWRVATAGDQKIKKAPGQRTPELKLVENPDILRTLAKPGPRRPRLVIGFAAETETVVEHAKAKRLSKGADWIVANDVSPGSGVMGGDSNSVHIITSEGVESWPKLSKEDVARRLVQRVVAHLSGKLRASD
ncbi:MAG: bifunctional phosphopantothenoylcysteine decarboxylase/phosphopantothenate--cysteine ligase CoaBC [Hyphomicrobiaceae bacterium]